MATWGDASVAESVERVRRWEEAVHRPGIYDLEVDTAALSAEVCATLIQRRLAEGRGTAFARAAALGQG